MFATGGCSDCLYPQWLKHFNPKPAQSTLLAGDGKTFKDWECQQHSKQRRITTSLTTHVLSLWINDLYLESQTALVSALHNELLGTDSDLSPRPADSWTAFFSDVVVVTLKGISLILSQNQAKWLLGFWPEGTHFCGKHQRKTTGIHTPAQAWKWKSCQPSLSVCQKN